MGIGYDLLPLVFLAAFWIGALAFGIRETAAPYRRDASARAGMLDLWLRPERLSDQGARLRRASLTYLYGGFALLLLLLLVLSKTRF